MLHRKRVSLCALALGLACAGLISTWPAFAQIARDPSDDLAGRSFVSPRLYAPVDAESLDQLRSIAGAAVQNDWAAFTMSTTGEWRASIDKRSGRLEHLEGAGIPWIPGRGNRLGWADVAGGRSNHPDMALMEGLARDFMPRIAALLGVNANSLALNAGRSMRPADYLWFVSFDVLRGGLPIEGAHVTFTVNNGNLIMVDAANLPSPDAKVPAVRFDRGQARQRLAEYLGGFQAGDRFVDRGSFHLLPAQRSNPRFNEGYEYGKGRELAGVWQFTFKRPGEMGTWRGRVDAATGEVLDFYDVNEYAAVNGGTYQTDKPATEKVLPMPFANVSSGGFTNSGGLYNYTSGTVSTTLSGQYVKITDSCGAISQSSDATGAIALGTSTGTDCTTPGSGGAGNTHAARTQFYNVNRIKEVGRGWLPSNVWLTQQLNVNVNLNQTCNAYWDGTALNFFKSGGGCNNTGELPGVSLHEYGHGLDQNDGNGSPPDNGSGETNGDFTAALAVHASCIGAGFLTSNCSGYGDACTACTGVRDIDYAKHAANTPATVSNFTQAKCPQPSANNPNYVGPCGADAISRGSTANKREGHCESYVSSEALWDLAARDLTGAGLSLGASWALTDRLWYLSRAQGSAHFVCNTSTGTWTSNGCAAGTLFRTFRAVDDDNGNLNDGTPHGAAIAAAMNRHGIACTTDTAWNTSFAGCTPPTPPTLAASAGNNSATLSWNATSAAYDVYRNETGCSAGFIKVANDVTTTSYTDGAVANGLTYYYQVVAQPSGNEACASAPSTCVSVTPVASTSPDFTIAAAPSAVSIAQGSSGSSTISTAVSGGFNSAIALSASGAPAGVTVSFSPTSIAAPGSGSSTMTITVASSAAVGSSTITVTGTGGSVTHTTSVSLTVTSAGALTATYDATLRAPKCASVGSSCDTGAALLLGRAALGPEPNQPNTINGSCADGTSGTFHSDESNDRLKVFTTDGSNFAPGKTVTVQATVWAYSSFSSDHLDLYYAANASSPTWTLIGTINPTVAGSQVLSASYTLPTGGSLQAVRANFRYTGSASSCSTGAYDDHDDLVFAVASTPDFSISASPTAVSVVQGNSGSSTITTAVSGGFNNAITLSASGAPAGVTVSFGTNPIAAPGSGSSTMTLAVAGSTATGTYPITVTGTGGTTTHTATVNLTVTAAPVQDFSLSASPTAVSVVQGNSGSSTISTSALNGFNNAISLSSSGAPAGVTVTFGTNPIAAPGTGSSTMTMAVAASTATGSYPITVTGTGGTTTHTATVTLTVTAAPVQDFSLSASPTAVTVVQGNSGSSTISTAALNGFNNAISLSSSGAPTGVTVTFGTNPIAAPGTGSSTMTMAVAASTATGTYPITVTGTGGTKTHTATVNLTVSSGAAQQLLGNPGFENGSTSPAPWVPTSGVIDNSTGEAAHSGSWKAWMNGYGSAHTDTLYQDVAIPASATTATLTFWLHIDTAETTTTTAFDTLNVQVRNTSNTVLATLATYSNLSKNTGYAQKSFNLIAYKGQTVRIYLVGVEDASLQTSFVVDDFALNVQ